MRSCMWDPLPVGVQGREKMRQLVESRKAEMSRILTELHHSGGRTVNKSCWCMTAEGKKSFIMLVLKLKPKWYWSIIRVKEDIRRVKTLQRALVHKPMSFFLPPHWGDLITHFNTQLPLCRLPDVSQSEVLLGREALKKQQVTELRRSPV